MDPAIVGSRRLSTRPYEHFRQKVLQVFQDMADYTKRHWEVDPALKTNKGGVFAVATSITIPGLPTVYGNYSSVTMYHGEIDALEQVDFKSMQNLGATLSTDTNPCKRCAIVLCLYNCIMAGTDHHGVHLPAQRRLRVKIPADPGHFHSGYQGAYRISPTQQEVLAYWVAKQAGLSDVERENHKARIIADFYALGGTT
jgi:hypothetical protein